MIDKSFVIFILFLTETNALKCIQNQTRITDNFQFTATECMSIGTKKATGCLTYTSFQTETITRMCDYISCIDKGIDRSNTCNNGTDSTTCCCLGDGCNEIFPSKLNTTTAAQTIDSFSQATPASSNMGMDITKSTTLKSNLLTIQAINPTPSNKTFFCYHGEGYIGKYNLSMKPILCPSKKCILFTAFCDEYWATTCYNDHSRMTLFKKFKTAEKLLKTQQFMDVVFCNVSNCNEYIGGNYYNFLQPNPIPFYPVSYKNQKHQRPRKRLENSVVFQTASNENISFIGTPETNAEKVWMEFRIFCWPEFSTAIYKLRYTFDRKKLTVNESTGIIKDRIVEDLSLKNMTSFSVNINASNNAYNLFVNGNDQKLFYGENSSNCTKMLVHGEKWKSVQASVLNKNQSRALTFLPSFEPDPSKYSSCDNEDIEAMIPNPNLNFTSTKDQKTNEGNQTIIKVQLINPLKPFGLVDVEFRKTLCEFSDLIKVYIRSISIGSGTQFYYHTTIWTRKNYLWSKFDDKEERKELKCTKFYVGVSETDNVMFFCDNTTIFSIPVEESFEMAQFSVQSIRKQSACF